MYIRRANVLLYIIKSLGVRTLLTEQSSVHVPDSQGQTSSSDWGLLCTRSGCSNDFCMYCVTVNLILLPATCYQEPIAHSF